MGQAYLYLSDAEGLVRCSRRVIELDPNHAAGHYYLAVGLLATGQVQESRQALARAMALGHRPTAEFLRGLEKADRQLHVDKSNLVLNIGAQAPENSKEN